MQTALLAPAIWRSHIQVAASLQAAQQASLAASRPGTVTAVLFNSGQQIAAGQILVQLANGPDAAQLSLDQARLAQSQRDLARTQKLMAISGASQSALDQAQANAAEARAQTALDEANLAQLQIIAPFAGIAGIRKIDVGDYLQAGQPVLSLTALGPLRVLFSIPQTEAENLAPGDPFTLQTPTGATTAITTQGVLTALSPAQDPATNARDVEGRVTGNANLLLPGMFGVVDIATGLPQPAFSVPSAALNDSTIGPFLFVLTPAGKNFALSTVYVTIDGDDGANSLVSAAPGLAAGERVVALGGFKLTDGASVTPETR